MTTTELIALASATLLTTAYTSCWIFWRGQTKVEKSAAIALRASVRMLMVAAVIFALLHLGVGISIGGSLGLTVFASLLIPMMNIAPDLGSKATEIVLLSIIWLPLILLKQFVFGFPDRDVVQLLPPESVTPEPSLPSNDEGTVVAVLRPLGDVEIDGEKFSAKSATGKMLPVGTRVKVMGQTNATLVVEETTVAPT